MDSRLPRAVAVGTCPTRFGLRIIKPRLRSPLTWRRVWGALPHDATPDTDTSEVTHQEPLVSGHLEEVSVVDSQRIEDVPVVRKTFLKAEPIAPPVVYLPPWSQSPEGYIMACAILVAIRLGRKKSEDGRLDWRTVQIRQKEYESEHHEIFAKRKELEAKEAEAKANETTRRVEKARRKAAAEAQHKKERETKYKEEQAKELEKLKAKRIAEEKAFKAQEARMASELARRSELEYKLIQEMEQKKLEAEELRRKEEEEILRQKRLEEARAAEEKRKVEELKEKARVQAERELESLRKKFAVRVEGCVAIECAPPGKKTEGPLPKDAMFSVSLRMKTVLVPEEQSMIVFYHGYDQAIEMAGQLTGSVARLLATAYSSAMRLQSLTSTGALQLMDELELEHWMRRLVVECDIAVSKIIVRALDAYKQGRNREVKEDFQVRSKWGVLPADNELRTDKILNRIVDMASTDRKAAARDLVIEMALNETRGLPPAIVEDQNVFRHLSLCLVLAHAWDRTLQKDLGQDVQDVALSFFKGILDEELSGAAKDSLRPLGNVVCRTLGRDHPIGAHVSLLSDQNMSKAAKKAELDKQKLLETELKAKVMQEEWPDREELAAARAKEVEDNTPVPERVWAMRNVARTLSMGSSLAQAKALIEKAIRLQEEFLQSEEHPGLLGSLMDYCEILSKLPEQEQCQSTWETILVIIELIAERYRKQSDFVSAIICLQAGVFSSERVLGERSPIVTRISRKAENLYSVLDEKDAEKVMSYRKCDLTLVVSKFTQELGAYKTSETVDRLKEWEDGSPLTSL